LNKEVHTVEAQAIEEQAEQSDIQARCRGALLGLAVGDAVGTTLEFKPPGSFAPIDGMLGGGPFHLRPGEWTDDTSMALCLAESLVECQGFDAHDQMTRYVRWMDEGYYSVKGYCFDIGGTVVRALQRFKQTAGNGSIMRLAPVALAFAHLPQQAIERAAESSRTTHAAPTAVDACRYLAALLVGALNGASKEELLADYYSPVPGYWAMHPLCPEVAEIAAGSFKHRRPPQIEGTGYVVKSLEAALSSFYHSSSFDEGCLKAVNLGNDADTTGAVYGQLAGAFYGVEGIPAGWCEKLALRERILELADGLYALTQK
jgi:ADP-ribosylglycohydrolase